MKKRIIVNTLIGFLVLFLTIGLGGTFYLIKWLNKEFDENLSAKSRVLVSFVKAEDAGINFDFSEEFMPEFSPGTAPEYFQLWLNNSQTLQKSSSLTVITQDTDLPVSDFISTREHFKDITLPDGRDGRLVRLSFFPQLKNDVETENGNDELIARLPVLTLAIAKERESLDKTIRDFVLIFSAIVILFTIIAALTIWQMVTKGLKPLKNLQRKMSVLAIDNLSERLELPNTPKELEDTVDQFNRMLERLENSFERERSFTSEIANELRIPISEVRSLAENASKDSSNAEVYHDILSSTNQMQTTVSNLMALARCEKGNIILAPQVIKLPKKIDDCWQRHQELANQYQINFDNQIDPNFKIISSAEEIKVIFNNLILNAITTSQKKSTVSCFCTEEADILSINISSQSKNLEPSDLDTMFERNWQKQQSSNLKNQSGLGLALVKSYAELLGLKIETNLTESGKLTISLCGFYQDH